MDKIKVHFVDSCLTAPTNPISVNVIGAGGTGSRLIPALGILNNALLALEHPGLFVRVFDADSISETNVTRQHFAETEIGLNKAVALVNRANRFYGSTWQAFDYHYCHTNLCRMGNSRFANITISCVDTVEARFEIADLLSGPCKGNSDLRDRAIYWLDLGNSRFTGQAVLATVRTIRQPVSKKYLTVDRLPYVTEEYGDLLRQSALQDGTPACSAGEALEQQDLFINPAIAVQGVSIISQMLRFAMIENKGFFMDILNHVTNPIKVG